jgi:hypothetical protein
MALKLKPIKTNYGVEFSDLYFKLTLVSYNVEWSELSFAGACYISKEAADSGLQPVEGLRISGNFKHDNKMANLYEVAYNHIKEIAASMKGKTREQIQKENDEEYYKVFNTPNVPQNIQDPNYLNFVDAEDC